MRKFVLIAAMALVSATAQAGETRSLSLTDPSVTSTQPNAAETTKVQTAQTTDAATPPAASAETPKFVERPAAGGPTPTPAQPKADTKADTKADSGKPVRQTAKADKRRHRQHWTEARIIGELHRHGIYWWAPIFFPFQSRGGASAPGPESRDSGFASWTRPGMTFTAKPSAPR